MDGLGQALQFVWQLLSKRHGDIVRHAPSGPSTVACKPVVMHFVSACAVSAGVRCFVHAGRIPGSPPLARTMQAKAAHRKQQQQQQPAAAAGPARTATQQQTTSSDTVSQQAMEQAAAGYSIVAGAALLQCVL